MKNLSPSSWDRRIVIVVARGESFFYRELQLEDMDLVFLSFFEKMLALARLNWDGSAKRRIRLEYKWTDAE